MQEIVHIALIVDNYDEAIEFFVNKLDFSLLEDTYQEKENKRWVVISPPNSKGTTILLSRAKNDEQRISVGNQSGGRVFLFLGTSDFWRDYKKYISRGIEFVREPKEDEYGIVGGFKDLYGN